MAEALVRTMKHEYARISTRPDTQTVIAALPRWFIHYNIVRPHRAHRDIVYRVSSSPRDQPQRPCRTLRGNNTVTQITPSLDQAASMQ